MASEQNTSLSGLGRPGRPFWTTLAFVCSLLLVWFVVIEGWILGAAIALPFVVLFALAVWFAKRLVELADVPMRSEPVTVAGVLSVLVLPYSLVVEGAVLLGFVACFLLLGAGGAVGFALAQNHQHSTTAGQSRADVEAGLWDDGDANDEREPERER